MSGANGNLLLHIADEARDAAMNREALEPDPLPVADDDHEPLPFDDQADAGDWGEDPSAPGVLPVLAGGR